MSNITSKTRVLLATTKLPPQYSGVGERVSRHAEYLHLNGYLSYMFTQTKNYKESTNKYLIKIPAKKIIVLKTINTESLLNYKLVSDFFDLVNLIIVFIQVGYKVFKYRKTFDVAHCFSSTYLSLFIALFSILLSKKVIIESTLLGDDSGPTGRLAWLKDYVYRNSCKIICISKALKNDFIAQGYKQESLVVIPNDVDLKIYFPIGQEKKETIRKELGLPLYEKIILFVGAFSHRKGFDILTNIFIKLSAKIKGLHLILVGHEGKIQRPIDIKDRTEFYDLINYYKLNDYVHKIGPSDKVNLYMKSADVFVFPSRTEGFGTVQIEAMASGCPVVSAYIPEITDKIIDNCTDGFIVYDTENIDKYTNIILELFFNDELRTGIVNNAIIKVNENYSREIIMQLYLKLYSEIAINLIY